MIYHVPLLCVYLYRGIYRFGPIAVYGRAYSIIRVTRACVQERNISCKKKKNSGFKTNNARGNAIVIFYEAGGDGGANGVDEKKK